MTIKVFIKDLVFTPATELPVWYNENKNWESYYGIDYYYDVGKGMLIGLQSKPPTFNSSFGAINQKGFVRDANRKFKKDFKGSVYYYYRDNDGNILNIDELYDKITRNIKELNSLNRISPQ